MSQNKYTRENSKNGLSANVILEAGLNVFGLQLVLESFTKIAEGNTTPLEFTYLGVDVTLKIAEEPK